MVGLPFPNPNSPEIQQKMIFMDKNYGKGCGQVFYQNLCMNAVNQSIGRAIR